MFLTTTPEFRRRAFACRPPALQFWRHTSDPASALERLLERDALFADQLTRDADGIGLKVLPIDGSRPEAELLAEVAEWFRL